MNDSLLDFEAVMERLSMSRSGVRQLAETGELRSVKVGRRRLFPRSAVDEFIAALQEQPQTARPA